MFFTNSNPKAPKRNSTLLRGIVFISLALLPLGYVGSYFAVLALPATVRFPSFLTAHPNDNLAVYVAINGEWNRYPDYHGLPVWLFARVHDFDRTRLRPNLWSGSFPRNQELSFDWLLGQNPTTSEPK